VFPGRRGIAGANFGARGRETEEQRTEEGIEALVEAAEEEGIIEPEQADLISKSWNSATSGCAK